MRSTALKALLLLLPLACGGPESAAPGSPSAEARITPGPHERVVLEMGELGEIQIELLPELAPRTVERFRERVRAGRYDGTSFHRVVPGFMVQGGSPRSLDADPRDDGRSGGRLEVPDEFSDHPMRRGTVALAHGGRPNSGDVQFFIVHQDSPQLEGQYTVFGRVVAGMDVVDAITELEIDTYGRYGPRDRPYPVEARMARVRWQPAGHAPASQASHSPEPAAPPGSAG